jgi:hypothetical protein
VSPAAISTRQTHVPSHPSPTFASTNTPENTLDDFPAETFTTFVFCDACDRSAPLDRSTVPEDMTVQQLITALRCSSCGSREAEIRIVYTGGGFAYDSMPPAN